MQGAAIVSTAGESADLQGVRRELKQVGDVKVVKTPRQLQAAILDGMPHIEIQDHMDLTELEEITPDGFQYYLLGAPPPTVKSIRVCCISCPRRPQYRPQQCCFSQLGRWNAIVAPGKQKHSVRAHAVVEHCIGSTTDEAIMQYIHRCTHAIPFYGGA